MSIGSPPETQSRSLPEISLLGVRLHAITEDECVEHILAESSAGRGGWVVTPNLDHLRRLVREGDFAELCSRASLRVADGRPLIWGAALQRTPLPGVVAGSNLIHSLSAAGACTGKRFFFLGGEPGTADETARVLDRLHSGLEVVGTACPPIGFHEDEAYLSSLMDELVLAAPDIVYVALGSPKQEVVIDKLRSRLPHAWFLGIGVSFSFVAGEVERAPRWMQRTGLEWVHRLCQEPRRLARRYLVDGLPFALTFLATCSLAGLGLVRRKP